VATIHDLPHDLLADIACRGYQHALILASIGEELRRQKQAAGSLTVPSPSPQVGSANVTQGCGGPIRAPGRFNPKGYVAAENPVPRLGQR